jgi:hypothetical protein
MDETPIPPTHTNWTPTPVRTTWDDLLEGVETPGDWTSRRVEIKARFLDLIRDRAAPSLPNNHNLRIESEWDAGDFRIQYVSYQVEEDERAHAYIGIPDTEAPKTGFPAVVCLHGTTNWGARRTLGLPPEPDDPEADKGGVDGKDFARQLVRRGYVTISPEHFCSAARAPAEGPYQTAAFYRKHPEWSAVGKYIYDSQIARTILANRQDVDASEAVLKVLKRVAEIDLGRWARRGRGGRSYPLRSSKLLGLHFSGKPRAAALVAGPLVHLLSTASRGVPGRAPDPM